MAAYSLHMAQLPWWKTHARLTLYLTQGEEELLRAAAERLNTPFSSWAGSVLLPIADHERRTVKQKPGKVRRNRPAAEVRRPSTINVNMAPEDYRDIAYAAALHVEGISTWALKHLIPEAMEVLREEEETVVKAKQELAAQISKLMREGKHKEVAALLKKFGKSS